MSNVSKRPQVIRDLIDLAPTSLKITWMRLIAFYRRQKVPFNNGETGQEWGKFANFLMLVWQIFGSRQSKGLRSIWFFTELPILAWKLSG